MSLASPKKKAGMQPAFFVTADDYFAGCLHPERAPRPGQRPLSLAANIGCTFVNPRVGEPEIAGCVPMRSS